MESLTELFSNASVALLSGLPGYWEAAYLDPVVADNHDSSGCQIFGDLVQVGQDDG
jgi:hypothetical protein